MISTFAMTFRRISTGSASHCGNVRYSVKSPSIRSRTRSESAVGSRWISVAFFWSAFTIKLSTRFIIGSDSQDEFLDASKCLRCLSKSSSSKVSA